FSSWSDGSPGGRRKSPRNTPARSRCESSSRWSTTAFRRRPISAAMARTITTEETGVVQELGGRARAAVAAIADYDQATVDRICRAIAWAGGNEATATRLANMSVGGRGQGRAEQTARRKVE